MKIKPTGEIRKLLPVVLAATLAGGCASVDWSRGVYEGVRQRQRAPAVPDPGTTRPPAPDYEQYRRERDALKTSCAGAHGHPAGRASATRPGGAPHRA